MKKIFLSAFCAVLTLVCCFALVACGEKDGNGSEGGTQTTPQDTYPAEFVGSWELYSAMGSSATYTVGDNVPAGELGNAEAMTLTSAYQTLSVTADGKFVWKNDYDVESLQNFREINGTWKKSGNSVAFTVPNGAQAGVSANYTATISNGKLSLSYSGDVTVFTKK